MNMILVLPDGETWTVLDGCTIIVIDDEQFNDLCDDKVDACRLQPFAAMSFKE